MDINVSREYNKGCSVAFPTMSLEMKLHRNGHLLRVIGSAFSANVVSTYLNETDLTRFVINEKDKKNVVLPSFGDVTIAKFLSRTLWNALLIKPIRHFRE